jgi:hypothetical protein
MDSNHLVPQKVLGALYVGFRSHRLFRSGNSLTQLGQRAVPAARRSRGSRSTWAAAALNPRLAVGSPWQQHPPLLLTAPPEKSTSTARLRQAGKPKLASESVDHAEARFWSLQIPVALGHARRSTCIPSIAVERLQHPQRQGERCCHARCVHVVGKSYRFEGRLELARASP